MDALNQRLMEKRQAEIAMANAQQSISLHIYTALAVDHIRGKHEVVPGDDGMELAAMRALAHSSNKAAMVLMESWGMVTLVDDEAPANSIEA